MSPAVIKGLIYILWVVLGFGAAILTFSMLTQSISKIDPNNPSVKGSVGLITAGRMLRLLIIAVLIYLALRWDFRYAITFIVAITVATWGLAIYYHLRAKNTTDQQLASPAEAEKEEPKTNA
ncbi:MAG: hypothetical protein GX853_02320 [Chloroflexi bacterium]|jgi:uncharacterized membrane protein|nr:hypothetical protein [Chloroflexota bacterium]